MRTVKSYRYWHNALYNAGYTEALAQTSNQRLSTLYELESVGQFSRGNAFGTSSREEITIAKATAQVFLAHRVAIELLPKHFAPTAFPLLLLGMDVRQKSKNRTQNR